MNGNFYAVGCLVKYLACSADGATDGLIAIGNQLAVVLPAIPLTIPRIHQELRKNLQARTAGDKLTAGIHYHVDTRAFREG